MGGMIRVLNNYPAQFASSLMKFVVALPWRFRAPSTNSPQRAGLYRQVNDCCGDGFEGLLPEYPRTNFGIFTVQAFPSLISYDTALPSKKALTRKYMMTRHLYLP
jgi:hypothetical protein